MEKRKTEKKKAEKQVIENQEPEKKKMSKKSITIITTVLVAAGLLFIPSLLAGGRSVEEEISENPVFGVRAAQAQIQTLHAYLDVNGDIVSTQQVEVFPDASGRVHGVRVSLGSYVNRGDIVAEIDTSRPGATFVNSMVRAPISGIVSRTPLPVGSTVGPTSSIMSISANGGSMEINARIPEREIAGLEPGLRAEATLQAYPGEIFLATVNRVSPIVDSASRTKLITIRFDQPDSRINPGMFARLHINTRSYPDVLTVPVEAVINTRGVDVVYVIETNPNNSGELIAVRREVTRGVTLQGWTEIRTGLQEGESVITQGQQLLSGGETVRVIGGTR